MPRLRNLLDRVISLNNGAFVEGRWIAENTVNAQEIFHKVRKHKGKNGLMILKLDLQKAYDRLEWTFVMEAMKMWGFNEEVRKMMLNCISTINYTFLVNGNQVRSLDPGRGLRQGILLSPYLFIICVEVLSRMIEKD